MEFKVYNNLCDDAMEVRKKVFIEEQGFKDEFDDIDKYATHIVVYDNDMPIGTCRFFWNNDKGCYLLGRLAVVKDERKNHLGSQIIAKAEEMIVAKGGKEIQLHSQEQAVPFYEKQGYQVCSDMEYEEHCPHYWMKKTL
jgi:predicted GNAT family N-acyltransferase